MESCKKELASESKQSKENLLAKIEDKDKQLKEERKNRAQELEHDRSLKEKLSNELRGKTREIDSLKDRIFQLESTVDALEKKKNILEDRLTRMTPRGKSCNQIQEFYGEKDSPEHVEIQPHTSTHSSRSRAPPKASPRPSKSQTRDLVNGEEDEERKWVSLERVADSRPSPRSEEDRHWLVVETSSNHEGGESARSQKSLSTNVSPQKATSSNQILPAAYPRSAGNGDALLQQQLQEELKILTETKNNLMEQLERATSSVDELKFQNERLKKELKDAEMRREELEKKNQLAISQRESEIGKLSQENQNLASENQNLASENQHLAINNQDLVKEKRQLNNQMADADSKLADFDRKRDCLAEEMRDSEQRMTQWKDKAEKGEIEKLEEKKKMKKLELRLSEGEWIKEQLEKQLQERDVELKTRLQEVEQLRKDYRQQVDDNRQLVVEKSKLHEKLQAAGFGDDDSSSSSTADAANRLVHLEALNRDLRSKMASLEAEAAESTRRLAEERLTAENRKNAEEESMRLKERLATLQQYETAAQRLQREKSTLEARLMEAELMMDRQKIAGKLKDENEEEILNMFAELQLELEAVKAEKRQVSL